MLQVLLDGVSTRRYFTLSTIPAGSAVAFAPLLCSSMARSGRPREAAPGFHFSVIPLRDKGLVWSAMLAEKNAAARRTIWLFCVTEFFQRNSSKDACWRRCILNRRLQAITVG